MKKKKKIVWNAFKMILIQRFMHFKEDAKTLNKLKRLRELLLYFFLKLQKKKIKHLDIDLCIECAHKESNFNWILGYFYKCHNSKDFTTFAWSQY